MPSEYLLLLRQESLSVDPGGGPPPSPHTCMFHLLLQGPGSRQFTDPWSDTLLLSGLMNAAEEFLSSEPSLDRPPVRGIDSLIVLQNVELQYVELQNAEFQNIELQNAELQNTELQNVESYRTSNLTKRRK